MARQHAGAIVARMDTQRNPDPGPSDATHDHELGAEAMPGGLAEMHRVIESLLAATRGEWQRPLEADAELRF